MAEELEVIEYTQEQAEQIRNLVESFGPEYAWSNSEFRIEPVTKEEEKKRPFLVPKKL